MARGQADGQAMDGLAHVAQSLAALVRADAATPYEAHLLTLGDPPLAHPPLQALAAAFALDAFEAQLLLLALGAELVPEIAALCATAHEDEARRAPSLRLALALFPGGDWHSLGPAGALRRSDLIEIEPRPLLLDAPLRLSEFTLHALCGAPARDGAVADLLLPLTPVELPPSHAALAEQIATALAAAPEAPRAHVDSGDREEARALAAAVAALLDMPAERVDFHALLHASDRSGLLRMLRRDQALMPVLLLVELEEGEGDATRLPALAALLERLPGPVLTVTSGQARRLPHAGPRVELATPTRAEQYQQWRTLLGRAARPLGPMLARYDLHRSAILAAYRTAAIGRRVARARDWRPFLSEACRAQLRGALAPLAERIDARAKLDDLILPSAPMAQLRSIIQDVNNQPRVVAQWQRGGGSRRGFGLAALFTGPSGSGKTTAAEAMATALDLDLYRIDLSAIVSKYIGETEKQLAQLFAAGQRCASILFFDEAEALFGKRTETRSSHDRFANQEVAYLLQRLESYEGLVILATNLPEALDSAFLRRFRTIVHFPLPAALEREAMWKRVYAGDTPVAELDPARLARLNLTGAGIRNVALRAAFLGAAEDGPVTMALIRRAAQEEYAKLHRIMTEEEWPEEC